jgi:hypothetical protein
MISVGSFALKGENVGTTISRKRSLVSYPLFLNKPQFLKAALKYLFLTQQK